VLRRNTLQQQRPQPPTVAQACSATVGEISAPPTLGVKPTSSKLVS
jgi:hypothetical protein